MQVFAFVNRGCIFLDEDSNDLVEIEKILNASSLSADLNSRVQALQSSFDQSATWPTGVEFRRKWAAYIDLVLHILMEADCEIVMKNH